MTRPNQTRLCLQEVSGHPPSPSHSVAKLEPLISHQLRMQSLSALRDLLAGGNFGDSFLRLAAPMCHILRIHLDNNRHDGRFVGWTRRYPTLISIGSPADT